jgi:hypothetical protein
VSAGLPNEHAAGPIIDASPFAADLATTLNDLINRHRNTDAWTDDDRRLAIALGKVLDPDAHRGNGVNALISQELLAEDRLPLADRADERDSRFGRQEVRAADGLANGVGPKIGRIKVQDTESAFARYIGVANHSPDGRHDSADLVDREAGVDVSVNSEIHHSLLALHGFAARYVTGAILAARWLQRRAWVRRAALATRPSDTTQGGGR